VDDDLGVTLATEQQMDPMVADGAVVGAAHDDPPALPADRGSRSHTLAWSWVAVAVPLVITLLGAWSYRWVQEDAFIDFRVVGNLLAGHGPVFNVGERVEVYSDPLWVAWLAVTHEMAPFLSLEWLSVLWGLAGTATGVTLCGRAIQRLGSRQQDGVIVPIGLLIFSVVAGVWEFATSGLEMGMVFGWIGLSFWLLVRTEERRRSAVGCALVIGLGPLIRPELALMSAVFLVGLAFVVGSPGWQGSRRIRRRWILPFGAAIALPVAYELWRMAYFAMFIANSELAKSGGGSDIPQGLAYVRSFVSTYALWIPFLLVLPVTIPRIRRWWSEGDRTGTVVLITPLIAGVADWLYVLRLGGDYMEARLLLPGFLCCCLVVFVDVTQFRTLTAIPLIGIVIWASVCASSLRYDHGTGWVNNMHDERAEWIGDTGQQHPIDASSYIKMVSLGVALKAAARAPQGQQKMLVLENPGLVWFPPSENPGRAALLTRKLSNFVAAHDVPARSPLPFRMAIGMSSIGVVGYLAGPQVYVYDTLSLANPVGSHTTVAVRGIPGHEKIIGPAWMIARFGLPGGKFPDVSIYGLKPEVAAARRALTCDPLKSYLSAITKPLTFSQAMSNIVHAATYTTMQFSPDANNAAQQLCR
jgi:arabinofuranosyltransferase